MDINEELAQQEKELERIRNKRRGGNMDTEKVRKVLNVIFLILAAIGVILYFVMPEKRLYALAIIGLSMVFKIIEFFLRFMF